MNKISYGRQSIDETDIMAVVEALKNPALTGGPAVDTFEEALAEKTSASYAVVVANGTAALHLACLAAGLTEGDEVLTTPLSFAATSNAALYVGAKPVFADIESDTGNIDTAKLSEKISPRTKAIIPVHYAGQPVNLAELATIAKKAGAIVIEDACHALGASYKGSPIGSCQYSDMSVFSFHPVKSITTGEGGAITTNSRELYEKLKLLRSHGIIMNGTKRDMVMLGYNYRLTDIQCALGLSQLKRLETFITRRQAVAANYNKALPQFAYMRPLTAKDSRIHARHLYPVLLDAAVNRDDFIAYAAKHDIMLQVHYGLITKHPYYCELGYKGADTPIAEDFARRIVSLPIYPELSEADFARIVEMLANYGK